jgi:hypothetical protein
VQIIRYKEGKTQVWKDVNETMKKGYFFNASYVTPTVMEPDERKESESMVSHLAFVAVILS